MGRLKENIVYTVVKIGLVTFLPIFEPMIILTKCKQHYCSSFDYLDHNSTFDVD